MAQKIGGGENAAKVAFFGEIQRLTQKVGVVAQKFKHKHTTKETVPDMFSCVDI